MVNGHGGSFQETRQDAASTLAVCLRTFVAAILFVYSEIVKKLTFEFCPDNQPKFGLRECPRFNERGFRREQNTPRLSWGIADFERFTSSQRCWSPYAHDSGPHDGERHRR